MGVEKGANRLRFAPFIAEREGFEPPVPCGTTDFETATFDHSAISPMVDHERRGDSLHPSKIAAKIRILLGSQKRTQGALRM